MRVGSFVGSSRPKRKLPKFWDREAQGLPQSSSTRGCGITPPNSADGHRRAAVQAAATALFDSHVPAKLNRQRDSKGGVDLMGQAFSSRAPEPDAPRLRFTAIPDGTPGWTSAHESA